VAGGCRLISATFLRSQSESHPASSVEKPLRLGQVLSRLRRGEGGRVLSYLLAMQLAVHLAGPYFVPYMIAKLQLTYGQLSLMIALSFVGKFTVLPLWGNLARRMGPRRLLLVAGVGVIPFGALWLVSTNLWYIGVLQFSAGCVWAGYELATFLIFFDAIDRRERTSLLAAYNLGSALAMTLGSLGGSALLWAGGETASAYFVVFGMSSALRVGTLFLLRRLPAPHVPVTIPASRTLAVRPAAGSVERPIYPTVDGRE
ncbi:MAG: MFS transporter, partial [Planctomycetales bacterium]|nr:MFS transporter [Planctomycetales bacterium]